MKKNSILILLFFTFFSSAFAQISEGDATVTCFSGASSGQEVAAIKSINDFYTNSLSTGIDASLQGGITNKRMWTLSEVGGEVFGTCYDDEGNIYFTATTLYGYPNGNSRPRGFGTVYKFSNAATYPEDAAFRSNFELSAGCKILIMRMEMLHLPV